MSPDSLLQTYRNQALRKQAESAKALDEFLDILRVRWNLKIDPITKGPSSTLKCYWWELGSVIQDNPLDLPACRFPPLQQGWQCPGNCRAHWRKNLPPQSTFLQLLLRNCPQNNVWHGPPKFRIDEKKSGKSQATNLLHTHQPAAAVLWHLKEAFGACDAPLGASLGTSVSHRDLAAMDVNKERKES